MKKFICLILLATMLLTALPFGASAAQETQTNDNIIYMDDGSYIVIEISENLSRSTTVKNTKTYTYYSSSGNEEWKAVLSGTFTYNGTTSTCTASSFDVTITNTNWYLASQTVGKSGNSATVEYTMGRKFLGITVDKRALSMTLTCDTNGNFS